MSIQAQAVIACRSYIECQFRDRLSGRAEEPRPFVTISRQAGAGGVTVGNLLGEYLREHDDRIRCECPWTVFDKELLERVAEDNNLSGKIIDYMAEDRVSEVRDTLEDLFGLHPSHWILVKKTSETILRLAHMGHVILVGRAANVITAKLERGFHARLVGSATKRAAHLEEFYGLSPKKAMEFLKKEDEGRKNYLKKYFGRDINDPLLYHAVINTDRLSNEDVARMIGDMVLQLTYGIKI